VDGSKRKAVNSLRKQLLNWLVLLLTLAGTAGGIGAYYLARQEPDSFLDNQLRQIALFVGDNPGIDRWKSDPNFDPEEEITVQIWPAAGKPIKSSSDNFTLEKQQNTGFANVEAGGELWRTYTLNTGARTVQVAQRANVRDELAANSALRTIAPILVLIPLSWLVVGWVTSRVLRPLDGLAKQVVDRPAGKSEPLPTIGVAVEILPFITSINALLARQHELMEIRQRFISDAAHQLRTPLTALRLQVSNLAHNQSKMQRAELMADMTRGLKRMTDMTAQLLKMARADQKADWTKVSPNDVLEIAKDVIGESLPLADSRNIDVGLSGVQAMVLCDRADTKTMIANIVDNAIRYASPGGQVDLAVSSDGGMVKIAITDSGPGMAEADILFAFDRFARFSDANQEGSGLGLAISKSIAEQHNGSIELANKGQGGGLVVTIALPLAEPPDAALPHLTKK
jgi:two-component system, OmpR family, sensor kinase